jgi:hypothetical protein
MAKIALLIGVSEYGTGLNSLPGAVRTVELMRQVLQPFEMGGFDEVKQLWNPNPPVMREAIETLFSNRTDDDLVLLFFSGYIIRDDNDNFHLATVITRKSPRAEIIRVTTIPVSFVQGLMNNSPCQQQVVILDCGLSCMSEPNIGVNDDVCAAIKTQLGKKGRTILTSFSSIQTFLEAKISSHSVYTRYFVEGVRTGAADLNSDGWISIQELHEYASKKTQIAAPAVKSDCYAVENKDDIVLSKASIDDPKLQYRKETEQWVRDGAISQQGRDRLDMLANSLGIASQETSLIEDEVLKPYHEYQEKLQRYQQEITKAIRNDSPVSIPEQKELKSLQQSLGLTDEDIALIGEPITSQFTHFPSSENNAEGSKAEGRRNQDFHPFVASAAHDASSENPADHLALADSASESNSIVSMPSSVLPDYNQIPPMQMNSLTPASTDEADEPAPADSESEANLMPSARQTVLQQPLSALSEPTPPTLEPTDEADEPTQLDSHRQPHPVSSSAKTVLQSATRLISEPTPPTLEPTDEADEPTQLDSHRQPHPVSSSAKTVLQSATRLISEPIPPTLELADEADEPTQLDSHRQPPASSSAKTVLQSATRLISEPIPPTIEPPDEADEPTQLENHRQSHPASSSANTVLQTSTQILPVQPTHPTPTPAVKSSNLADVPTNPASATPLPNKLLLAIGIGGVFAIAALAIGIATRKPVAPPAERTDKVSSSPTASPNSSSTATKSDKESSATAPSNSKDCTIFVNGNLRSTPVSTPDNVVASLREKLSVTGKRTKDGWVQVKLPSGKLVWAHPGVISGASESEMEDCIASKRKTQ